jgi:hypothetical protein
MLLIALCAHSMPGRGRFGLMFSMLGQSESWRVIADSFGVNWGCGLINPQHLKLLSGWRELYRHLIALAFSQHGPAQRGFAADDLNEF